MKEIDDACIGTKTNNFVWRPAVKKIRNRAEMFCVFCSIVKV